MTFAMGGVPHAGLRQFSIFTVFYFLISFSVNGLPTGEALAAPMFGHLIQSLTD